MAGVKVGLGGCLQFGYVKVRYRGLAKNTAQLMTLFALGNLWMVRKELMKMTPEVRP